MDSVNRDVVRFVVNTLPRGPPTWKIELGAQSNEDESTVDLSDCSAPTLPTEKYT